MQQALHLMFVERVHGRLMVTQLGRRWLLPVLYLDERARAGPIVHAWLAEHALKGNIVGQWLGRATPGSGVIDWLVVIISTTRQHALSTDARTWVPRESLVLSNGVVDYQRWALAKAIDTTRMPRVPGPFGSTDWLDEVCLWVNSNVGTADDDSCDIVSHRTSAYEVVMEFRMPAGRFFFKGLSGDRAHEAVSTSTLASLVPHVFPSTRKLETKPDGTVWWLMDACRGSTLSQSLSRDRVASVAIAYARIQQHLLRKLTGNLLDVLPPLEIEHLYTWAKQFLEETRGRWCQASCTAALEQACEFVRALDIPCSWVAGDSDPTNILVHGDDVSFVDLDESCVGPAPLVMATLARRLERAALPFETSVSWRDCLYEAYERGWSPPLRLAERWPAFEAVSLLVECKAAWKRVELKTARGEVDGIFEAARERIGQRLERAVTGFRSDARIQSSR